MINVHLTKKYTFLCSLLLLPLYVNTFAAVHEEGQPVNNTQKIKNVNPQKVDFPKKIVISNAVSWTILLTLSATVYWILNHNKDINLERTPIMFWSPITYWFEWFFVRSFYAFTALFGNIGGRDEYDWDETDYHPQFIEKTNYKLLAFKTIATILIVTAPLYLPLAYHYLKSNESFHQWLEKAFPDLYGYMKTLFVHKDSKGETNKSLVYFFTALASFSLGTLFIFPPIFHALVSYGTRAGLQTTDSFICGLLGTVFIPILFYLPSLIIGMPLEAAYVHFRGARKQPAPAPVNQPGSMLATQGKNAA